MEGRSTFDLNPPEEQIGALSPLKRDHHGRSRANSHVSEVNYEDELEKYNADIQIAWSKVLDEDELPGSNKYKRVHVLMLSWEQEYDDLHVDEEVASLAGVFRDEFNYEVTRQCVERTERRKTQAQLNATVATWLAKFDGTNTLLIIYFAGHGRPGETPGSLVITGQRIPSDERSYLDRVIWNKTEQLLTDTQGDVLQIFDCCHAGIVATRDGQPTASEFLAATTEGRTTPKPGPTSFTRALIWALKQLVETEGRFTTGQLTNKIRAAPDFPKDQQPILVKRNDNSEQVIILQPLSQEGSPVKPAPSPKSPAAEVKSRQDVLTLKFVFNIRPTINDISNLGRGLWYVIHGKNLNVSNVNLVGVQPKDSDVVYRAAKRFRSMSRRLSSEGGGSMVKSPVVMSRTPTWYLHPDRDSRPALELKTLSPDGGGEDSVIVVTPTTVVHPPATNGDALAPPDGCIIVQDVGHPAVNSTKP